MEPSDLNDLDGYERKLKELKFHEIHSKYVEHFGKPPPPAFADVLIRKIMAKVRRQVSVDE